jgi:DNA-binding transcriptional LysR family regulator
MALVLAIHEHRSITAAAAELGFSQPAASRALRDIEQLLRVHIFDRDRAKGMSATGAGCSCSRERGDAGGLSLARLRARRLSRRHRRPSATRVIPSPPARSSRA